MVTTSPVPFTALPRQQGGFPADTPPAQSPFATAVDKNFTAINTQLTSSGWANRFKVTRVKPVLTLDLAVVKAYSGSNYLDGLIIGDLRFLMITVSWATVDLDSDAYGGVSDRRLGTLKDTRFWPGTNRELWFVGDYARGMCVLVITKVGDLILTGLGSGYCYITANDYIAFNAAYMVYGS